MARDKKDELRLRVHENLKNDLMNIAKNTGITMSSLLKPALKSLADSYPEHMKKEVRN